MRVVVPTCVSAALAAVAVLSISAPARAASFAARLYAGPGYMSTDTQASGSDSSGPALLTQLDAGVQLSPLLQLHGTLLYEYSSWMAIEDLRGEHSASMLRFGVGATLALAGFRVGASVGGQFTSFTSLDDPSSGPNERRAGLVHRGTRGSRAARRIRHERWPARARAPSQLARSDAVDRLRSSRVSTGPGALDRAGWRPASRSLKLGRSDTPTG
jgi:hypothetical protein